MTKHFSLYLDLLRFLAAFAVLLTHGNSREFVEADLFPVSMGHNAVVVFFLLSGYVIAFVADTRENSSRAYWISRCARIYSVALPAMLLTPFLDLAGGLVDPEIYAARSTHDYWWIRLGASLAFLNEIWFVSIAPFSNTPYWSLCYEMSYYLLFGIFFFWRGRARTAMLLFVCLIVGPKILLLFPLWLVGVFLYRYRPWYSISERLGWVLGIGSLCGLVLHLYFDVNVRLSHTLASVIGPGWYTSLGYSRHFLSDYVVGVLIAANFVGMRAVAHRVMPLLDGVRTPIKFLSTCTFAIYLFHLPVLLLVGVLIDGNRDGLQFFFTAVTVTLVICLVLGAATERFKDWLKRQLETFVPAQRRQAAAVGGET